MDFQEAYIIVASRLKGWLQDAISAFPNVVVAIFVLVLFYLFAILNRRIVRRLLSEVDANESMVRLASKAAQFVTMLIGTFIALGALQLDRTVTSLLAGAGVFGLALGFAFKEIVSSYMSGFLIALRRPYIVGDIIETNDFMATVIELNLRTTVLENFSGQVVIIPNAEIFSRPLVNYSKTGRRRIEIIVPIAQKEDLQKAKEAAVKAVDELPFVFRDHDVEGYYIEIQDGVANLELRFWVKYPRPTNYFDAQSQAIAAIKQAMSENGISVALPGRHLRIPAPITVETK